MKLELKHLVGYLDTGLKVLRPDNKTIIEVYGIVGNLVCHKENNELTYSSLHGCKPLLLPLSALTEALPDGSIPIVELAKMQLDGELTKLTFEFDRWYIDGDLFIAESGDALRLIFNGNSFWMQNGYGNVEVADNQLQLFEYLYANHFDIYGLIPAGIALDKRTIKL